MVVELVVVLAVLLPLSLLGWLREAGSPDSGTRWQEIVDTLEWALPAAIALVWVLLEISMTSLRGQTPGKREMQIRVVGAERGAALVGIALWRSCTCQCCRTLTAKAGMTSSPGQSSSKHTRDLPEHQHPQQHPPHCRRSPPRHRVAVLDAQPEQTLAANKTQQGNAKPVGPERQLRTGRTGEAHHGH